MKKGLMFFLMLFVAAGFLSGCKKGIEISSSTALKDIKVEGDVLATQKDVGYSFVASCKPDIKDGSLWGSDVYTTDSSVCLAAVHAGIIQADKGGEVKVTLVAGLDKYPGSDRNGITSDEWKTSWGNKAFSVSAK